MTRRRLYTERVRVDLSLPMKQDLEEYCRHRGVREAEIVRSLILEELRAYARSKVQLPAHLAAPRRARA